MVEYIPLDSTAESTAVADDEPGAGVGDTVSAQAVESFEEARAEFKSGNYEEALKSCRVALSELPKDATLHEFRSLTLFALGRYRESAAAVHAVLAVGPGMDWTTMSSFYDSQSDYISQLRALENDIRQNRREADARFLLAYHYITLGHNDAAKTQLKNVLTLEPKDDVAADLMQILGGEVPEAASPISPPVELTKGTEAELLGSWQARQPEGVEFELTLRNDGTFDWSYSKESRQQKIQGVFVIDDGVLAMEPDSGGVMLADVSQPVNNSFTFRQNGTGEAAITFQQQ